jgi:16S rRNA C1402 (ribose-2'-O) methylase RsmI
MLGRELTKVHEFSVVQPTSVELAETLSRGEFVLVISPAERGQKEPIEAEKATTLIDALVSAGGMEESEAVQLLARALSVEARELIKVVKKYRISVKQQSRVAP